MSAVLACDGDWLVRAEAVLHARFGEPLCASEVFAFTFTDYYAAQTGPKAVKRFLVFPPSGGPGDLAAWKRWAGDQERILAAQASATFPRPVNIDPGVLRLGNLTLASTKDAAHRVVLGEGIFAEVTLLWRGGGFEPLPWTYPDYRTPLALAFFTEARSVLKRLRKGP
jgi:hypothetical protein